MKKYLIILSGWAVDSFAWEYFTTSLSKDFKIVVITWEHVDSVDGFKQKVTDFIKEKDLQRFSMVGWSLGALVALDVAKDYSMQMDHLILISGTSRFIQDETERDPIGWNKKIVARMLFMLKEHKEETLRSFYKNLFTDKEESYYKMFMNKIEDLNKGTSIEYLGTGLEYLMVKDLRKELDDIYVPTLLIHGDEDKICPVQAGEYLKKHLKRAKLVILYETGHMPFFTKGNECCEIIKKLY